MDYTGSYLKMVRMIACKPINNIIITIIINFSTARSSKIYECAQTCVTCNT
eukprot:m.23759 g.23759  ORF g.23759 m.23759 type:complete len:51 (+) comp8527_c0_seq1:1437-1589(+)